MPVDQERTLRELELRVRQQSAEAEKGNVLRQRLMQEKAQLEIQVASIAAELQEAKRRCVEIAMMGEDYVSAMNLRRSDQCEETSEWETSTGNKQK